MRRIIPFVLVVALLLSLSLSSAAAETTEVGKTAVKAVYVDAPETPQIISVDIVWGGMEFTYQGGSESVWDPKTHSYKDTGAGWAKSDAYISLTNHSNVLLKAGIDYTPNGNYGDISLEFTDAYPFVGSAETVKDGQGQACTVVVRAIPTGTPDSLPTTSTAVGEIKVTVQPWDDYTKIKEYFEDYYDGLPVNDGTLERGSICYSTEEAKNNAIKYYGIATKVLESDPAANKNLAWNQFFTSYYNELYLVQEDSASNGVG